MANCDGLKIHWFSTFEGSTPFPRTTGDYMNLKAGPIQVFVSDIEKAKKWYSQVLSMELLEDYDEFKCLLMKLGAVEYDIGVPLPNWGEGWDKLKIGGLTNIFFETTNITQTVEDLKQRGVQFIEEPAKQSWGEYKAIFADPDGNEFSLIEVK